MRRPFIFLFSLVVFLISMNGYPMISMGKEIQYNHNSKTISEIQSEVDFAILSPQRIPKDWTLDTKTSPWIMLHYMNSEDTKLMVSIHLRKGCKVPYDDSPYSQQVDINGNLGYFNEWVDSGEVDENGETITGGILYWAQDGTTVQMMSSRLSKEQMIDIARSMN
nr:DUF4367 domain-containing protein [Lysinibacillus timonensis]